MNKIMLTRDGDVKWQSPISGHCLSCLENPRRPIRDNCPYKIQLVRPDGRRDTEGRICPLKRWSQLCRGWIIKIEKEDPGPGLEEEFLLRKVNL